MRRRIDDPDPVIAGETLTYTIQVFNDGPSTALNVTATRKTGPVYVDVIKDRQTWLTRTLELKDPTAHAELLAIRQRVFVEEQGVPRELEHDAHDASAIHLLALSDRDPVGTARLLADGHIQGCMSPEDFQLSEQPTIRAFVEETMGHLYSSDQEEESFYAQV